MIRYRHSGPPMNAVTTPTSNTVGANAARPMKSDINSKNAPKNADAGIK